MPAIVGFHNLAASTLTVTADEGMIDEVAKVAVSVTAIVAGSTFKGFLVSEDGDGTYTITHTADDIAVSAILALAAAEALDVPAGGIALFAGSVGTANAENPFSVGVRGNLPPVSDGS